MIIRQTWVLLASKDDEAWGTVSLNIKTLDFHDTRTESLSSNLVASANPQWEGKVASLVVVTIVISCDLIRSLSSGCCFFFGAGNL